MAYGRTDYVNAGASPFCSGGEITSLVLVSWKRKNRVITSASGAASVKRVLLSTVIIKQLQTDLSYLERSQNGKVTIAYSTDGTTTGIAA